jgi:hypothetical protein
LEDNKGILNISAIQNISAAAVHWHFRLSTLVLTRPPGRRFCQVLPGPLLRHAGGSRLLAPLVGATQRAAGVSNMPNSATRLTSVRQGVPIQETPQAQTNPLIFLRGVASKSTPSCDFVTKSLSFGSCTFFCHRHLINPQPRLSVCQAPCSGPTVTPSPGWYHPPVRQWSG